jgi:hypothetical protein
MSEQIEFAPRRPAVHVDIAAKPHRIDRAAGHVLQGSDRGEVDDGDNPPRDIGKAVPSRRQDLRRPAQFVGTERRKPRFDGGAAFRHPQVPARYFCAVFADHEHLRGVVEAGVEPGQPFILHQHQEPLLGQVAGRRRVKTSGAVLDGVAAVAGHRVARTEHGGGERFRRQALYRVAVDGPNCCRYG